ncbi:MAG: hypothetical protein J3Q66DRAFT_406764 [Benniella sp.]|nr:MAG: hypothetical protein J3Q66DRAFT_406764 [Benniella sp.]
MLLRALTFNMNTLLSIAHIYTFLLCILIPSIHAAPRPALPSVQSSAFTNGHAIYVLTNSPAGSATTPGEAFMIDLTVSWSTNSPVYKPVTGGPSLWDRSVTISSDQSWLAMANGLMYLYNFQSSTWDEISSTNDTSLARDIHAATDPDTGIIYVLRQSTSLRGNVNGYLVSVDTKTRTVQNLNSTLQDHGYIAWSAPRKSLLYFGRVSGLLEYKPSSGWSPASSIGLPPSPRSGACFIPAYGGTKMILFGTTLGDIYILDTATLTWTKGPRTKAPGARYGAACGVSNDDFVIWSGNAVGVFNLKELKWGSNYLVPGSTPPPASNVPIIATTSAATAIPTATLTATVSPTAMTTTTAAATITATATITASITTTTSISTPAPAPSNPTTVEPAPVPPAPTSEEPASTTTGPEDSVPTDPTEAAPVTAEPGGSFLSSSKGTQVAIIAGAVVGGLAVVIGVGLITLRIQTKRRKAQAVNEFFRSAGQQQRSYAGSYDDRGYTTGRAW